MPDIRVKKILSHLFNISIESINEDTSHDTVAAWDSLAHMNLIIALEEEFSIKFTDIQMMEMLSYPLIVLTVKEAFAEVNNAK